MYIVSFRMKNFRSYKEERELSFVALPTEYKEENVFTVQLQTGEQLRLLKVLALYGANASGKSNVILAMRAMQYFVRYSRTWDVNSGVPYEPFILNGKMDQQPVELSIDFVAEGKYYRYAISYDQHKFLSEFLYEGLNQERLLLSRQEGGDAMLGDGVALLPNHLLLSECGTKGLATILPAYSFVSRIQTESAGAGLNLKRNNELVAEWVLSDETAFERLQRLLHVADENVVGVGVKRNEADAFRFPEFMPESAKRQIMADNAWEITLKHTGTNGVVSMPIESESTGTKALFGIGAWILDALMKGGLVAFDEINIALHPELFRLLVEFFQRKQSNPHCAQMVFTTHDTSILQSPRCMLRADQIWFAEKDSSGISDLFAAKDFEGITTEIPFEAWYRAGRFGARPSFGNVNFVFEGL